MIEHKHLIIRADVNKPPMEVSYTKMWLADLVGHIGMRLLDVGDQSNPIVAYCGKEGNRGLTAAAIIDTSHIVLHSWDEASPAIVQLDVYTCSLLDINKVLDRFSVFEPIQYSYFMLDRKNMLTVEVHEDWINPEMFR